jgi:hypothetical protein
VTWPAGSSGKFRAVGTQETRRRARSQARRLCWPLAAVEAKETNRAALIASQEKMKVLMGATILGDEMASGKNIQGVA